MDFFESVFELIDMRSFSNLWYWIALAVLWSSASHYVLGVPFDMIMRARRMGEQAASDLDDLVRINVNRLLYLGEITGIWVLGFACFVVTGLFLMGFVYDSEFAQALFLILFPLFILGMMSVTRARQIVDEVKTAEDLHKALNAHRFWTQVLGVISIFITAIWGMYQNLNLGALG
ncbi:MAG: component of SufBCD complex [Pseudomonadota bacterium]